VNIMGRC